MHIRTVRGGIPPAQLGVTLGHEHLLIDLRGLWDEPPTHRAHWMPVASAEQGYVPPITLAHDICIRIQFHLYGGWDWDHLLTNIVPRLRHAGASQRELDAIFIDTPG